MEVFYGFQRHRQAEFRYLNGGPSARWSLNGGVSRVAKGADCKSAASWLRRFESFLPHHNDFYALT